MLATATATGAAVIRVPDRLVPREQPQGAARDHPRALPVRHGAWLNRAVAMISPPNL
jgi:hypothetical protein